MGIIDGVIILLIVIFMIIGFTRGFLKQVLSTLAWIIALIAALMLCNTISEILYSVGGIGDKLYAIIYDWVAGKGEVFTTVLPTMTEEYLITVLNEMGIPSFLHKVLIGMIDVSQFKDTSIVEFITPVITTTLFTIITFIIIYIIVFILVKVISSICNNIVKGSALGFIDGTLGAIWGAIKISILISILMLGLSFVVTMPFGEPINEWITVDMESELGLAKFFYENNPIYFIISKLPFGK